MNDDNMHLKNSAIIEIKVNLLDVRTTNLDTVVEVREDDVVYDEEINFIISLVETGDV